MDSWYYNSGARNQDMTGGAYEFHIHRVIIALQDLQKTAFDGLVKEKMV